MKPFRTSITARIISGGAIFALAGGGIVAATGINPAWGVPIVLLFTALSGIVGLVLGANDHPGAVLFTALLLPLALWPYTMVLIYITTRRPEWGPVLFAAALLVLALTLYATVTVKREEPETRAVTRHA